MLASPFAKFLEKALVDNRDALVRSELLCLQNKFISLAEKRCPYCKYAGHRQGDCPVFKELKSRCVRSGLRD